MAEFDIREALEELAGTFNETEPSFNSLVPPFSYSDKSKALLLKSSPTSNRQQASWQY